MKRPAIIACVVAAIFLVIVVGQFAYYFGSKQNQTIYIPAKVGFPVMPIPVVKKGDTIVFTLPATCVQSGVNIIPPGTGWYIISGGGELSDKEEK